ncbi:Putative membrane protein [Idiomarina sp. A28L]|uniref:MAPEG family protein n=1 Tax=Idiomarina sp. A28L TaxID=1036674 RepID=UPI0002138C59|nr:MAPEG family protein [Idiomarina sp. A28L]EGN74382.1 Putative membrane protein [Idiomarina sp. A28L]
MNIIFTTLFITMLLPFLAKAPLVIAMNRQPGGYNNRNPRKQQAALTGFGERATAAHYNSFEALAIYASAVLVVAIYGTADAVATTLAWVFVASRVLYLICYWYDHSTIRSLVWLAGIVSAFVMAGRAIWG